MKEKKETSRRSVGNDGEDARLKAARSLRDPFERGNSRAACAGTVLLLKLLGTRWGNCQMTRRGTTAETIARGQHGRCAFRLASVHPVDTRLRSQLRSIYIRRPRFNGSRGWRPATCAYWRRRDIFARLIRPGDTGRRYRLTLSRPSDCDVSSEGVRLIHGHAISFSIVSPQCSRSMDIDPKSES